jgi:hypothetical protein
MARDKNAPKKPCTGYLNYANSIRAEVAAESGVRGVKNAAEFSRRWKALPEAEREKWNSEARAAIGAWKVQMDAYKQTDEYKQFQTNKTKKKFKKAPKDKNAPKKPLSAFFLYSNEVRESVRAELDTNNIAVVGKKIGAMWKELSEEEKQPYRDANVEAKAAYEKTYAAYQETEDYQNYLAEKEKFYTAKKKAMKRLSC